MKKIVEFISILLCISLLLAPFSSAEGVEESAAEQKESVLNVSPVSEEQAQLCAAVMLDGFEADETERAADKGTLASISSSALEGEKCMKLTGNDKAGMTLTLTKRRSTANTRSLCVCAYVEPTDEAAEFVISVTLNGEEKTFSGSSDIPAGKWCAAYLVTDPETTVNIKSVTVTVSERTAGDARVSCLIDRVHTATVDGLPDRLRYFASDFTPNRGEMEYTDDALIFRPTGANSYLESSLCGYMTNGDFNALAIRIANDSDAENMILRLKLDKQYSYTEENSHSLQLQPGERVYSFPIGGFRSGTTVESFKLEFPGGVSGEIAIKSIGFSSYRFPSGYGGEVKAEIKGNGIAVYGNLPDYPASSTRICLYRLNPGFDEEEPGGLDAEPYAETSVSSSFSFDVPLTDGDYNNAYFKYLVRYETKTGYEDAGVAFVNVTDTVIPSLSYKGAAAPEYSSILSYLMPGTVYLDVDLGRLFAEGGDTEFGFAGKTSFMSSSEIAKYDEFIQRCSSDGVSAAIRLVYSPFPGSEKYYFVSGTSALPDITMAEGASHYMALLSFFAERYKNKISVIIPCGALDSTGISEKRVMTPDKAEKYAVDIIRAAQSAVSKNKTAVAVPVSANGAAFFLSMLGQDIKDTENQLVYIEAGSADEAEALLGVTEENPFAVIISCRADSAPELAQLYYGCKNAAGICVRGLSEIDDRAELFSLIDTTYGVTAADKLAADGFPDGVAAVYQNIDKEKKKYEYKGELLPAELPQMITALYDGSDVLNWQNYDCCKSIYTDTVNGEAAAGLSFDFTSDVYGYAAFSPDVKKIYNTVYFRFYADYLPEDVSGIKLRIYAESEVGITAGYCILDAETVTVIPMQLEGAGRIKRFTFAPLDMPDGSTPRICVTGIYTSEKDSSDTLTDVQTETMPEPESQQFDSAEVTEPTDGGRDSARLYIIAICVIIGMFALCGVIILILKKRDQKKEKKEE